MKYAHIILPLALRQLLTYHLADQGMSHLQPGMRVVVPLGDSKLYTGIVHSLTNQAPEKYETKQISEILDSEPIITPLQILFWEKMSSYYMCTLGEVMSAALPAGLKLASESKFRLAENVHPADFDLSDKEYLLAEAMEVGNGISLADAEKILGIKSVQRYLKALIEKGIAVSEQELKQRYKPKLVKYIELSAAFASEENLKQAFDSLKKAEKQSEVLTAYLLLSERYSGNPVPVTKKKLTETCEGSVSAISSLIKKGIFTEIEFEEGRIARDTHSENELKELSSEQNQAFLEIKEVFAQKEVALLYGITSSGKTEVYMRLIKETLEAGKQVLFLIPEIALTTQLIYRLKKFFPGKIAVYHSKFNENERVEVWKDILKGNEFKIVAGARSALFLPFSNLGLIIVDEEHESTFKQSDPAPRYNARDFAVVLASLHGARVLMGSATPSIETYYNAKNGKFGLVKLNKRFGNVLLPEIFTADTSKARKMKEMKSHFTPFLLNEMQNALEAGEQIILFRNRRGHSLSLKCEECGQVPQCKNCDISLTYYKNIHQLRCRYCGYTCDPPKRCGACGNPAMSMKGFGTEKIEEELPLFLPDARIERLDLDSASLKSSYHSILSAFENRGIDILIGTQMVSKGLDFDNVSLVGILDADGMLFLPDFRAHEKAFQLMTQVSGRAGRRQKRGKVIIQTDNPEHFIIRKVIEHNFEAVYDSEILERINFKYPPFVRLIKLTVKHSDFAYCKEASDFLGNVLKKVFAERVFGPEAPQIGRIKNNYLFEILLKFDKKDHLNEAKKRILNIIDKIYAHPQYRNIRILPDVDPQ